MRYLELDGVFVPNQNFKMFYEDGFELINPISYQEELDLIESNKKTKEKKKKQFDKIPLNFNQDMLVIIEIKRSFNMYTLACFVDKVMGMHDYYNGIKKKIQCFYFYDNYRTSLKSQDINFIKYLKGGVVPNDLEKNLKAQSEYAFAKNYKDKLPYITKSIELFRNNKDISIDVVFYDSIVVSFQTIKRDSCEVTDLKQIIKDQNAKIDQLLNDMDALKKAQKG